MLFGCLSRDRPRASYLVIANCYVVNRLSRSIILGASNLGHNANLLY
jgi:hypothetical protein